MDLPRSWSSSETWKCLFHSTHILCTATCFSHKLINLIIKIYIFAGHRIWGIHFFWSFHINTKSFITIPLDKDLLRSPALPTELWIVYSQDTFLKLAHLGLGSSWQWNLRSFLCSFSHLWLAKVLLPGSKVVFVWKESKTVEHSERNSKNLATHCI